jgi:hypothetical protein
VSDRHSATVRSGRVDATRLDEPGRSHRSTEADDRDAPISSAGAASAQRRLPGTSPTDPGRSVLPTSAAGRGDAHGRTVADSIWSAAHDPSSVGLGRSAGTRDGGEPVRQVSSARPVARSLEQSARHETTSPRETGGIDIAATVSDRRPDEGGAAGAADAPFPSASMAPADTHAPLRRRPRGSCPTYARAMPGLESAGPAPQGPG